MNFALIFKLLPDARMRWRDVWFGAATTAVLFALGSYLIGLYLGHSAGFQLRSGGLAGGADRVGVLLGDHHFRGGRANPGLHPALRGRHHPGGLRRLQVRVRRRGLTGRAFQAIQHPGDSQGNHQQPMEAAPGETIQAGRNVGLDGAARSRSGLCLHDSTRVDGSN